MSESSNNNNKQQKIISMQYEEQEEEERTVEMELTHQEELNRILEDFFDMISEEEILKYQQFLEGIQKKKIAENAIRAPKIAPNFKLIDQDGDVVHLKELLKKGPVVLVFYRGKWCPHCCATLIRLSKILPDITKKGATLVAISPMLPDGTQYLAQKENIQYSVVSDVGNDVAKQYNITMIVPSNIRENFITWGEDIPTHNGDHSWEIPLPATYVINQNGKIVWDYINNDPGYRANPIDIVKAIPKRRKPFFLTELLFTKSRYNKNSKSSNKPTTCSTTTEVRA